MLPLNCVGHIPVWYTVGNNHSETWALGSELRFRAVFSLFLQDFAESLVWQYGLQICKNKQSIAGISLPYLYMKHYFGDMGVLVSLKAGHRSDPQRDSETWESLRHATSKERKENKQCLILIPYFIFLFQWKLCCLRTKYSV